MQRIAFISCLALLSSLSLAQDRVLLEPLTAEEEDDARERNAYFIGQHTFAAKRHRLVKVNTEFLESDGRIVIPLFDDRKIVVDSTAIEIRETSGTLSWQGRIVQDAVTEKIIVQAMVEQGVPEHLDNAGRARIARVLFEQNTKIQISAGFRERDSKTGANLNPIHFTGLTAAGILGALSPCQPNRYAQYSESANFVLGSSASLSLPNEPVRYHLDMLGMGGPYHILYELDPARQMIPGNDLIVPGEPYESGLSEEQERKNRILMEVLRVLNDSLGENPHDVLYEERMIQVRDAELKQPEIPQEDCVEN